MGCARPLFLADGGAAWPLSMAVENVRNPGGNGMASSCLAAATRGIWLAFALLAGVLALFAQAGTPGAWPAPPQAVRAPDGAVLDVGVLGAGEPLLLLTGYAMTSEMWDQTFVDELARSRRVILLDNVGMGPSRAPAGTAVSMRRMAEDAVAVLDALGIGRCDVLGWSMGGMIAQELALAHPQRVRSLVLLSSASEVAGLKPGLDRINAMDEASIRQAMFPPDWLGKHPEAAGRVAARPRPPDMAVIQGQLQALVHWEGAVDRLDRLQAPVMLLVGDDDWLCPPQASRDMHARLSTRAGNPSVLVEFGQGSHWLMHQYPAVLAGLVGGHLAALGQKPQP